CRYWRPFTLHRTMSPTARVAGSTGSTVHSWPDSTFPRIELPRGRNWTVSPHYNLAMSCVAHPMRLSPFHLGGPIPSGSTTRHRSGLVVHRGLAVYACLVRGRQDIMERRVGQRQRGAVASRSGTQAATLGPCDSHMPEVAGGRVVTESEWLSSTSP